MPLIVADREFDQSMEQISSSITDLSQHCQRFGALINPGCLPMQDVDALETIRMQQLRLSKLTVLLDRLAEQVKCISDGYLIDVDQSDGFLY